MEVCSFGYNVQLDGENSHLLLKVVFFLRFLLGVTMLTWLKDKYFCLQGFLSYRLEAILGILITLKTKQSLLFPVHPENLKFLANVTPAAEKKPTLFWLP